MEYSKEDLMEAKRQILGVGENMGTEESKKIWEKNAQFWDDAMGDESNEFHREVVRPKVTELLSPDPSDYILDIACGNGNYSSYLAQRGASVVAFDYSKKMIELAKRRQSQYAKQIEFCVADATDRKSILELKRNRAFTKAVSNMAIMDITDIEPLLKPYYHYHRNFFVGFKTFFIKSINDKSSSKTKVKNILYGTMIINLLFRLPFNRYIIVTVRCHIFFSQQIGRASCRERV